MPKSAYSFDRITIPAACDADWDAMVGNDQVRFCKHCGLHVTNLSSMTRSQAMRFVEQSRGRLCVRYLQRPNGEILTKHIPQQLHQISHRVSRFAAAALSASFSLASAAAQSQSDRRATAPSQVQILLSVPAATEKRASMSGVVKDPNGAVVPEATVTLVDTKAKTSFVYVTGNDGGYNFSLLEGGAYNLSVDAPGFSVVERKNLELPVNSSKMVDVDLTLPIITAEVEVKLEIPEEVSVQSGVVAIREPTNPLAAAAHKDDLDAVKELLPVTTDVNAWDEYTNTNALAYAIENDDREMVKVLLSAGANVNSPNKSGRTPLMYLGEGATTELIDDLLAAGANVHDRDGAGSSVLANVIVGTPVAVVKQLIKAGARLDTLDDDGNTVLMRAAGNDDPLVVPLLLTAGVDVAAKNTDGDSALTIAARSGKSQNLKALLDAGSRFNLPEDELTNLFLQAAINDDPSVVRLMLEAGANANAKDDSGTTALMSAALSGKPETLKILIAAGADLNTVDDRGVSALMRVSEVENARALLDAGADMSLRNKEGKTALALAIENNENEIIKLLKSRGAPE